MTLRSGRAFVHDLDILPRVKALAAAAPERNLL